MEKIVERQIKFRAWDKNDKRMIVHEQDFIPLKVTSIGVFRLSAIHEDNLWSLCPTERFYLMQWTGKTDKKGTEIYDGDIVRILYTDWPSKSDSDERTIEQYMLDMSHTAKVVWGDAEWVLKFSDDNYGSIHCGKHGQIVVIGNIHTTPELLKN